MPHLRQGHSADAITTGISTRAREAAKFFVLMTIAASLFISLRSTILDQSLRAGDPAPDAVVKTVTGEPVVLRNLFRNRVALLFLRTDCPHCRRELFNINRLQALLGTKLQVLLVSEDRPERTKTFLDSVEISLPAVVDETGETRKAFKVFTVPALFLIDQRGIIRRVFYGESSLRVRTNQVEAFLQATETPNIAP